MNNRPSPGVAPIEPLLDWEGPAINYPSDPDTVAGAANWVVVTTAAALLGNSLSETLKSKIISFLLAWRSRDGGRKLEDLKQQVVAVIEKQHAGPQKSEPLRLAVEQLFDSAEE